MYRFVRTSLTTIGLTSIALAALAGGRAQSADTDLQPALQQLRDEVRDLRHDVKALRELLEEHRPAASADTKAKATSAAGADSSINRPVAYFFYAKWCGPCQVMMPIIDRLRAEGYPIIKVDVDTDRELRQHLNVTGVPSLWIESARVEYERLTGVQTEESVRSAFLRNISRPAEPPAKASPMVGHPDDRPTSAYFFYSKQSRPCQRMMPIIDRLQAEGHRIIKVDVDAPMTWEQTTRFRVTEVPTIWFNAGDQGAPMSGIQTEEKIRQGLKHFGDWRPAEPASTRPESHAVVPRLDRHVTVDCDNLPVSEVLDQIFRDRPKIEFHYEQPFSALHYPYFHFPASESDANRGVQKLRDAHEAANLDARCPGRVTLHVADVPVSVALRRVFDQLHVGYKFENEILRNRISRR